MIMTLKNLLREYHLTTSKLNLLRKQLDTEWKVLINEYSPVIQIANVTVYGNFDSDDNYPDINLHCQTLTQLSDELITDIEQRTGSRLDFHDEIISNDHSHGRVYVYDFKIRSYDQLPYSVNESWLKD